MEKRIIALSGEAGVGKDSFAVPLLERHFMYGSFAGNLKEMCKEIFNLTVPMVETQRGKAKRLSVPRRFTVNNFTLIRRWMAKTHDLTGLADIAKEIEQKYINTPLKLTGKPKEFTTPREILQFVGTEVCRKMIETYHVDVLVQKIKDTNQNVVITDARFPNERQVLKDKFNAYLIRIIRPGFSIISKEGQKHPSETSLGENEDYDLVIINDGTLKDLHKKAEAVYDESYKKIQTTE